MFIYQLLGIEKEDFLDINLEKGKDIKFFVDPFIIANSTAPIGTQIRTKLFDYFNNIMDMLVGQNFHISNLGPLHEVKEAKLGYGVHHGSGSDNLAQVVFEQISISQARTSGLLTDLLDINLFVKNIGPDRTSDWMLNIIFDIMQNYTIDKLRNFNYPFEYRDYQKMYYDSELNAWSVKIYKLPVYNEVAFLLTPKCITNENRLVVKGTHDFVDHGILSYVINNIYLFDELQTLITTYRSGVRKGQPRNPTKKDIREYYNTQGKNLYDFASILWLNERFPGLISASKVVYYNFRNR
ncbi:MAG TPA: hypothetical protein PLP48_01070 [Acholeplasmataceae bacterium]|nr:hypothetical protein [Acholeplasmataceae bacterium]